MKNGYFDNCVAHFVNDYLSLAIAVEAENENIAKQFDREKASFRHLIIFVNKI